MPARTHQIEGGSRVIVTTCEVCGGPAPYGFGVNLRRALAAKNKALAAESLGKWYCGIDKDLNGVCIRQRTLL